MDTFTVPSRRFVEYLEERLPAHDGSGMSLVFDSLVQRFLDVERYANDIRYVNYCIKSVSQILWRYRNHACSIYLFNNDPQSGF